MARSKPSGKSGKSDNQVLEDALREHIRAKGNDYLKDPNITSVGIGLKNGTGPISLQFTVGSKLESAVELEALGTEPIPDTITLPNGLEVVTDIIERNYKPAFELVEPETLDRRRIRVDPIQPGISIAHPKGSAGTIGLIVYDRATGAPCVLSNWHVLHTSVGAIGDSVVQPGPFDDNNLTGNLSGDLLRSHLGNAGDCALARIRARKFSGEVFELGVTPKRMAKVSLGDRVVKSGRTTGVTFGIVRRIDVIAKINYKPPAGEQPIGGFEIGVDPDRPPSDGEISKGGDSGSAWLIAEEGAATDIFAGLHFAGETDAAADEHALACYPLSVQKKLDFVLEQTVFHALAAEELAGEAPRRGYDPAFLAEPAPLPKLSAADRRDTFLFGDEETIPYTHFSVCLSQSRRMARYVAWNIDGGHIAILPRREFKLDPRAPAKYQLGNEIYRGNRLDKGHIARRADLVWGPPAEAEQANRDSNFYTNIAPQHERYNQSSRKGLWGNLENLILEQVDVQDVKMSVIAGPIFGENDIKHRGALIPEAYWKLVAYVGADGRLRTAAFILSQFDLLSELEAIDLDPFKLYQVSVGELGDRTGLGFAPYRTSDVMTHPELGTTLAEVEALEAAEPAIREIGYLGDLRF